MISPETKLPFLLFASLWCVMQKREFPRHQQIMAIFLATAWQNGERQLLLMAFRASGKSTLVGLFCAWLLYQNHNLCILILSAEQRLATKMVRSVRYMFDHHPLLQPLKPQPREQWASDEFTIKRSLLLRDPSIVARGLYGNITGFRADIIICDDVEVIKNSHNSSQRHELRRRLSEVDFILTPPIHHNPKTANGFQLYIGTPHHQDTIYNNQSDGFLSGFTSCVIPLLDNQGHSAWPEKFTPSYIKNLQQRQTAKKFLSQMMLKVEKQNEQGLDIKTTQEYDGELIYHQSNHIGQLRLVGCLLPTKQVLNQAIASVGCFWDPAFGRSDKDADRSMIAIMMKDNHGHFYLQALHALTNHGKDNPAISQIYQVLGLMEKNFARGITIENNGLGKFLPSLLRHEIKKQRKLIAVNEICHRQNKRQRIFAAFDSLLAARALYIHQTLRQGSFYDEMADFQLHGHGHDDGLDATAGCIESRFYRPH
ncbi:MAG: phage terminase large subunit [Alphaproteobacteria bacterium]